MHNSISFFQVASELHSGGNSKRKLGQSIYDVAQKPTQLFQVVEQIETPQQQSLQPVSSTLAAGKSTSLGEGSLSFRESDDFGSFSASLSGSLRSPAKKAQLGKASPLVADSPHLDGLIPGGDFAKGAGGVRNPQGTPGAPGIAGLKNPTSSVLKNFFQPALPTLRSKEEVLGYLESQNNQILVNLVIDDSLSSQFEGYAHHSQPSPLGLGGPAGSGGAGAGSPHDPDWLKSWHRVIQKQMHPPESMLYSGGAATPTLSGANFKAPTEVDIPMSIPIRVSSQSTSNALAGRFLRHWLSLRREVGSTFQFTQASPYNRLEEHESFGVASTTEALESGRVPISTSSTKSSARNSKGIGSSTQGISPAGGTNMSSALPYRDEDKDARVQVNIGLQELFEDVSVGIADLRGVVVVPLRRLVRNKKRWPVAVPNTDAPTKDSFFVEQEAAANARLKAYAEASDLWFSQAPLVSLLSSKTFPDFVAEGPHGMVHPTLSHPHQHGERHQKSQQAAGAASHSYSPASTPTPGPGTGKKKHVAFPPQDSLAATTTTTMSPHQGANVTRLNTTQLSDEPIFGHSCIAPPYVMTLFIRPETLRLRHLLREERDQRFMIEMQTFFVYMQRFAKSYWDVFLNLDCTRRHQWEAEEHRVRLMIVDRFAEDYKVAQRKTLESDERRERLAIILESAASERLLLLERERLQVLIGCLFHRAAGVVVSEQQHRKEIERSYRQQWQSVQIRLSTRLYVEEVLTFGEEQLIVLGDRKLELLHQSVRQLTYGQMK